MYFKLSQNILFYKHIIIHFYHLKEIIVLKLRI